MHSVYKPVQNALMLDRTCINVLVQYCTKKILEACFTPVTVFVIHWPSDVVQGIDICFSLLYCTKNWETQQCFLMKE